MEVLECEACGYYRCTCYNDEAQPKATSGLNETRYKQVGGNHYKDKKLQPWDIIDALDLNFYEGNALKYLIRYKEKNGVEDLKKSIHYIEKIIEDVSSTTSSDN